MVETCLPVLVLRNIILFPQTEIRIELENDKDKELISLAESYYNKHILVVHPNDMFSENISVDDYPKIGVLGYINMKLDLPNNKTRIVIRGINRVQVKNYEKSDNFVTSVIEEVHYKKLDKYEEIAFSRSLIKQVEYYIDQNPNMSNSVLSQILGINDIDKITDVLVMSIPGTYERKLEYLNEIDPTNRVMMLLEDINQELKIIKLEQRIEEKVNTNIDKSQRDFILQEKIKVIKEELGVSYDKDTEIDNIRSKMNSINLPDKVRERLNIEISRYEAASMSSPEVGMIKTYIDTILSLPWNNKTIDNKDLNKAMSVLDSSHFGLSEVKERIIEYLALLQRNNNTNSPIICLVGPPGVGKTTFAKSVADAMNRCFTKVSVGGINDESDIIGHKRAYIGSSCGKIIQGMRKAGSSNPVFVIDEIDKMTKDINGDPASTLLEVLDKEQNKNFCDNYIEEEFDLSNVMFICTANYIDRIPLELLDRLEIIQMSSYTEYEKINICKKHIIPKGIKEYNLEGTMIEFTDDAILKIIRDYTKEAGVRELERLILSILRKIIKDMIMLNSQSINIIDNGMVVHYLGKEKYSYHQSNSKALVGVVNGMSYTIFGGDILKIEVNYFKGHGSVITTGQLGDVFIESAKIALSYIKSNYKYFGVDYSILEENDIHIHVPEGAIRKDGPSAGTALTTAIISAITKRKIPSNISMTGEITLRGEILAIGGLKEKIIGAKRAGVTKIYLPSSNEKDLEDIEDYIKEGIRFVFVSNYKELYKDLTSTKKEY